MGSKLSGSQWLPLLVVSATALAVQIPFIFKGAASGHDFEFHLYSWLEILGHWKHGIFYPRWAALAQFGYGEPRFVFYPPGSWSLGGVLSALLPWTVVSFVYIWIALVAAGMSMFVLARQWLSRGDAIFSAALYAANPYHLVIVYWRSAFAELLAACLLPLLVLLVLRAAEGRRVIVPLGCLLAMAWLTNAPAAVMIHYSLALLMLLVAWHRRSARLLLVGASSVALGACLASFYLMPAVYEQKWVNIGAAISEGSRPVDNFLLAHSTDADHDRFNRLVTWVALAEIAITFAAAWATRKWRANQKELWLCLVAWGAACCLLMFPVSTLLWDLLPKLKFMQFPWRWLLCLGMSFSLLVTLAVRHWWRRLVICVAVVIVIAIGWQRIQTPWWDNAADLREMQDNMENGVGYEGTDEYAPVGVDPSDIDKDARKVTVDGPAHAAIHVFQWGEDSRFFTAQMSEKGQLALRLFNYPAWRVEVNGRAVEPGTRQATGQMLVPVEKGLNRVQLTFMRTWDRTAGGWISALTLVLIFIFRRNPLWTATKS